MASNLVYFIQKKAKVGLKENAINSLSQKVQEVLKKANITLKEHQLIALVSYASNLKWDTFLKSELLQAIKRNIYDKDIPYYFSLGYEYSRYTPSQRSWMINKKKEEIKLYGSVNAGGKKVSWNLPIKGIKAVADKNNELEDIGNGDVPEEYAQPLMQPEDDNTMWYILGIAVAVGGYYYYKKRKNEKRR